VQLSPVRVLIVDDFVPWQVFVERHLATHPNVQVIGFAADGVEAVRKAEELLPDLILLDIGLPKANGIEAAKQIRKRVPASAILFLSDSSDPDVVNAALDAGGSGYVLKTAATKDLMAGTRAVLDGEPFLSRCLAPKK
jgi:DNA-binding NarL/FixJ family response regulator